MSKTGNDSTGVAVMVVSRGAIWWGYVVERRGKREAWLLESPDGGYRYASIHAALYHYDKEGFSAMSQLLRSKDYSYSDFEKERQSIVGRLKPFSPKSP